MVEEDEVFAILKICPCLGESEPAHSLVLNGAIRIHATDRNDMIFADLATYAASQFRVALRGGGGFSNRSSEPLRKNDGLRIFLFPIRRDQERSFLAVAQRSQQTPLENAALLRWTG